ncbi:MAG: hypothetical protein H7834_06255 [Magnetococcus sp. YQC-9]
MRNLKLILSQLVSVALISVVLSGSLTFITWLFWGRQAFIDTELMSTIYAPEPIGVAHGVAEINSDVKNIFLIGSSNVREGFRPTILNQRLSDFTTSNFAIGASNIAQLYETVGLVNHFLTPAGRQNAVYVVGIWYGQFVSNNKRWGPSGKTDLDNELQKFRLFTVNDFELYPRVFMSHEVEVGYIRLFLPLIAAKRFMVYARSLPIRMPYKGKIDDVFKAESKKFWHDYMGTVDDSVDVEQFEYLHKMASLIDKVGSKLILVDMPIPNWHKNASAHNTDYQNRVLWRIEKLAKERQIAYLDMRSLETDGDFYDSAHPTSQAAQYWSASLSHMITESMKATGYVRLRID